MTSNTLAGSPPAGAPTRSSAAVHATPAERKRERLAYWAYRLAEAVLQRIPRPVLMALGEAAGLGVFQIARQKRALTQANLSRPLGVSPDHPRVRRAAQRVFRNYAKYLVDVIRLAGLRDDEVRELVQIENIEVLTEARAAGKGVVLCCVHVGGMDMIGPALKRHGQRIHVVADDTSYGRLFEHLRAIRMRHEIHLIPWRNLRQLFRNLRAGENLVLFCDWGYRAGDVPVEFFGEATTFPVGPATLAAKSGAPMLPVHVRRTRDDGFVARGLPPIHATGTDPSQTHQVTQQLADALAGAIASDPGQWYIFRHIWPQTDADRRRARAALEAARRGDDWTRLRLA